MAAMAAAEAIMATKAARSAEMMVYQLVGAIILRMVKHFYK
jgi:hypothetical protein